MASESDTKTLIGGAGEIAQVFAWLGLAAVLQLLALLALIYGLVIAHGGW